MFEKSYYGYLQSPASCLALLIKDLTDDPQEPLPSPLEKAMIHSTWLARIYGDNNRFKRLFSQFEKRFLKRCMKFDKPLPAQLKTINLNDWTNYYNQTKSNPYPVVIKGIDIGQQLTSAEIMKHHKNLRVILSDTKSKKNMIRPLGDLRNLAPSGGQFYAHNCSEIILTDPEPYKKFADKARTLGLQTLDPNNEVDVPMQLFLAYAQSTGTGFHANSGDNIFFQCEGKKKWTFVHPRHTYHMYLTFVKGGQYYTSRVGVPSPDRDYAKIPLYEYCPRFEVNLEPGDVLYNPAHWWHAVSNTTYPNIGIASRWAPTKLTSRLFRTSDKLVARVRDETILESELDHGLLNWPAHSKPKHTD